MTFPCYVEETIFSVEEEGDNKPAVNDTCLFMVLPYFLLSGGNFPRKRDQLHQVRGLVESLYRHDSPFSRELDQAANRLEHSATASVIYVPQVWCLLINDGTSPRDILDWPDPERILTRVDFIATCAPTQLHSIPTSNISTSLASKYDGSVRLRLRWGLKFCIKLEECKTWFVRLLICCYCFDSAACLLWFTPQRVANRTTVGLPAQSPPYILARASDACRCRALYLLSGITGDWR